MNKQINLPLLLFILSCSEDDAIISNTPSNLPDQNYKITLQSNSGTFLETVTISWNETEGEVELYDSGELKNPNGNSHTFSGMNPGEFRDITIQVITNDSIYVDSIQIFTRPVYPVYNFRYEVEIVMRGNGVWDEGEDFTDINSNNVWNAGEEFIDIEYEKYHRILNWTPTIEPDSTFSNYTIYRVHSDSVDTLINPENCGCDIASLSKLDSSFTDSNFMVTEEKGEYAYYYQIRVNSTSGGRNSYIYNYTDFESPQNISLVAANVSDNNTNFIQITWDAVSDSTYLYQYEIWRISDDNADDLRRIAIIVDPDQEKFMDRTVGNGTSYNYSVAVVAINGDRVFSDYVTGWSIP